MTFEIYEEVQQHNDHDTELSNYLIIKDHEKYLTRKDYKEITENQKILELVVSGNEYAVDLLYRTVQVFLYTQANKFNNYPRFNLEEFVSIANLGFLKAVKTYKPEKGIKFVTYLSSVVKNEILMYIRRDSKFIEDKSLFDKIIGDDISDIYLIDLIKCNCDDVDDIVSYKFLLEDLDILINFIGNKMHSINQKTAFYESMMFKNQKYVAKMSGITQSYVSRFLAKTNKIIEESIRYGLHFKYRNNALEDINAYMKKYSIYAQVIIDLINKYEEIYLKSNIISDEFEKRKIYVKSKEPINLIISKLRFYIVRKYYNYELNRFKIPDFSKNVKENR